MKPTQATHGNRGKEPPEVFSFKDPKKMKELSEDYDLEKDEDLDFDEDDEV
jgi:hypothetical protein